MAIFNSYVKLPEGKSVKCKISSTGNPDWVLKFELSPTESDWVPELHWWSPSLVWWLGASFRAPCRWDLALFWPRKAHSTRNASGSVSRNCICLNLEMGLLCLQQIRMRGLWVHKYLTLAQVAHEQEGNRWLYHSVLLLHVLETSQHGGQRISEELLDFDLSEMSQKAQPSKILKVFLVSCAF